MNGQRPRAARRAARRGRVTRVLIGSGWQAAPGWLAWTATLLVTGAVCSVAYPVGFAVIIDAALRHEPDRLALGAAVVAFLYTLSWVQAMLAGSAGAVLSDRTTCHLTARVAGQLNAVTGIDHLERPAYLTELDLLRQNMRLLGNGPRQVLLVIQVLVRTAAIVAILAVIFPPIAVLPVVAAAPVAGTRASVWLRQRTDERLAARRRLADELFSLATSAASAKELRVFGSGGAVIGRHRALAREVTSATTRASVLGGILAAAGWLVFAGGFVAGIAVVATRAAAGTATIGEVVLAVTLIQRAQLQVGQAAAAIGQLLTTARTARRLLWLEDYAAARPGPAQTSPAQTSPAQTSRAQTGPVGAGQVAAPTMLANGVTLRGVSFAYPPGGTPALDGLDLRLPAGAAVALVGENGAGKTTLVKLLTGMYRPTAGEILVDGVPLTDIDLSDWRSRTAAAFQDFVRFELVASQTVGVGDLPRLGHVPSLTRALQRADATALAQSLPEGLDTRLGRSFTGGQELSGGEWQRLALARCMMRGAPLLLILDEPTASLDAISEAALLERYLAARQQANRNGAITLLVSHRFSTVRMADLIVVLERGQITAAGDHASLMRDGGLYAELYAIQARSYR